MGVSIGISLGILPAYIREISPDSLY